MTGQLINIFLTLYFSVPLVLFILFTVINESYSSKLNLAGSIMLILSSILVQSLYMLIGFPKIHYSIWSAPGIGEVYGVLVDTLSVYFGFVIGVVGGLILLYSIDYMSIRNNYHPVSSGKNRFYAWMYLFIFSVLLFVYSPNMIQMLIAFELMSLACWGLISYYGSPEAERSSYKMLVITHLGAYGGLAAAIALLLASYGSTSFEVLSSINPEYKLIIIGLLMWAAITKSSQFPTYSWLPDAMVAPTPTSALLHGATMIEMGPYLVARALMSMGAIPLTGAYIVLVPVSLSLVIATVMYPMLRDGKRLLAYSTIAEVAFMYFAVALMFYSTTLGLIAFSLHFTVHAFLKSMGFLLMGYSGYVLGTHDLEYSMKLFSSSKLLKTLYIVSLFGLVGAPVYGLSKIYVLLLVGPLLSTTSIYTIVFVLVALESIVLLMVAVKWLNHSSPDKSLHGLGGNAAMIPKYMLATFTVLLVSLYLMQLYFFTTILPVLEVTYANV